MRQYFFLALIILGAFLVRLYMFQRPLADWHSWRQVDTSSVSRHFVEDGFDVLHPKFDDLSKNVSDLDNPQGYRFVEFPLYNIAQAGLFKYVGYFSLEQWGRLVSTFSQLVSIVFLFLFVKKYTGFDAGIIAGFFYGFVPYNIFYGSTVLPDSTTVTAILASLYYFSCWLDKPKNSYYFLLALIATGCAFLLKPYAFFFMLPHAYMALNKYGHKVFTSWKITFFIFAAVSPFIFWRFWMQYYPEGIPQSSWLFNGTHIRFKGAFFNWIFAERISKLILGYFGLPFVIIGIIRKIGDEGYIYLSLLLSSLIYVFTMATGNVQHDYYQILIIPTLAIFFAKGITFALEEKNDFFNRYISYTVVGLSLIFMIAFGWYTVKDYYNIQRPEVVSVGRRVNEIIPKEAKVVAPYGGDTTFLYHMHRSGWPVFDRSLSAFIKSGANYMVFLNPTSEELNFTKYFEVQQKDDNYIIYNLSKLTSAGKLLLSQNK